MNEKQLRRVDIASMTLLLLWSGMVLGFAFLTAPAAFAVLPSRELAGSVVGAVLRRLDLLAWFAFGLPLLLSYGARWLAEVQEEAIGPMRLWSAAALVALLMCLASSAIISPRLHEIRVRAGAPVESWELNHPDRVVFNKAHSFSRQLMLLRLLLALGLAAGVSRLPGLPKRED